MFMPATWSTKKSLKNMRSLKSISGFTLVEILIAVGILAGAVAMIMPQVNVSTTLSVEDNRVLQMVLLASNKMVEVEQEISADITRGKFPDETKKAGTFEEPFEDYVWDYSISKVEIPVGGAETEGQSVAVVGAVKNIMKEISKAVREIKLKVTWTDPKDPQEVEEYTLTTHVVNL